MSFVPGSGAYVLPFVPPTLLDNMILLSDQVLGADSANIDLSGIPQSYIHLIVVANLRTTTTGTAQIDSRLRFNNDSGANYDWVRWLVTGSSGPFSAGGNADTSAYFGLIPTADAVANKASGVFCFIANYAATVFQKTFRTEIMFSQDETNDQQHALGMNGGAWRSTAAINRITWFPSSGNFKAGSRLTLYGL